MTKRRETRGPIHAGGYTCFGLCQDISWASGFSKTGSIKAPNSFSAPDYHTAGVSHDSNCCMGSRSFLAPAANRSHQIRESAFCPRQKWTQWHYRPSQWRHAQRKGKKYCLGALAIPENSRYDFLSFNIVPICVEQIACTPNLGGSSSVHPHMCGVDVFARASW